MADNTFVPPPSFSFPQPDVGNNDAEDPNLSVPLTAVAPTLAALPATFAPPGLSPPRALDQQPLSAASVYPYEPDFHYSFDKSTIISHDPKLNSDGEALHAFLVGQSSVPPRFLISIRGTHTEKETRLVQPNSLENEDTSTQFRTEDRNQIVTDFKFCIDVTGSGYITRGPVQWTCADSDAAFRGGMVKQVDVGAGGESGNANVRRRKATHDERKETREDEKTRKKAGFAPWLSNPKAALGRGHGHGHGLSPIEEHRQGNFNAPNMSSKSLRDWTEEYATSSKRLKEFVYKKVVYGWDTTKLTESITHSIRQQMAYKGNIVCTVSVTPSKICIRADNSFSRMMSSTICKILLSLVLVYPILWLVKRYGKSGGGKWKVAGAAYEVGGQQWTSGIVGGGGVWDNAPMTPGRPVMQVGYYRGEEFFRDWEPAIIRCAMSGVNSDEPLRWDRPRGM